MSVDRLLCIGALLLGLSTSAAAQKPAPASGHESYDELLARYLRDARDMTDQPEATEPSWAWMNSLELDTRARAVNDLLTIHVIENISASGSADSALAKASAGSAAVTSFFGLEKKAPRFLNPTSLAALSTNTDFKGGGTTNRAGQLTANLTGRVTEVLPNGDLVIEGIREIDINGDRQIVVLTGVVRPVDIDPNNAVLSPYIGQLRIRYFGQGLIRDNLKPGWIIRILNRIF